MTDYECRKIAKMQAEYLVEALKKDDELLDLMYPPMRMGFVEAAEFLGIPIGTLRHLTNEIPHVKVGKRILFTDRALTRWLMRKKGSDIIPLKSAI